MTDVAPGQHMVAALEECIMARRRLLISAQSAYEQGRRNFHQAIKTMADNELTMTELTLAITELESAKQYYLTSGNTPPIPTSALVVDDDPSAIVLEDHQPDQEQASEAEQPASDELRP